MSSRQKFKVTNDIFEMISDNDDEIKFDDLGILKPVTVSKSTIVVVCRLPSVFTRIHFELVPSQTMISLTRQRLKHRPAMTMIVRLSIRMQHRF